MRAERSHAQKHQERVAFEWDRTLELIRQVDFDAIPPGEMVEAMRTEVEIWNDLTLEPPRRISTHGVPASGLRRDGT
jgi:hypothetical protein